MVNHAKFVTRWFVEATSDQKTTKEDEGWLHTVRVGKALFSFLEVTHLVHNFLHETLKFSHFRLKAG